MTMIVGVLKWIVGVFVRILDWVVDTCLAFQIRGTRNRFLEGNYAPVEEELTALDLPVRGHIPRELRGEFVRNGPNPKSIPHGGYHWFDGDGMLHGVRLFGDNGKANYVNRYVQTGRLKEETAAARPLHSRLGKIRGILGILHVYLYKAKIWCGLVNEQNKGTANTAVQFHAGRLLALVENDFPYAVKVLQDGVFETLGRHSYEGKLNHPFTAHPKIDPVSGEMMTFGYQLEKEPFLVYSLITNKGKLVQSLDMGLRTPVMMHDMAITENYSIFLDLPLEFVPKDLVTTGSVWRFNDGRPSRIGVIPRHATSLSTIRWFEFGPCMSFHTFNAWEEECDDGSTEIVVVLCRSDRLTLDNLGTSPDAEGLRDMDRPYPHTFRMNLGTGATSSTACSDICGEFPVVDARRLGRRSTIGFMGTISADTSLPSFEGVVKFDMSDPSALRPVGHIKYGPGKTGGECQFVPRDGATEEGDGFLLTFVYDERVDTSEFWVLDAHTMDPEPIAVVPLPQRVPYGFHGIWVEESDLEHQDTSIPA